VQIVDHAVGQVEGPEGDESGEAIRHGSEEVGGEIERAECAGNRGQAGGGQAGEGVVGEAKMLEKTPLCGGYEVVGE
jgi:hypothetical protein